MSLKVILAWLKYKGREKEKSNICNSRGSGNPEAFIHEKRTHPSHELVSSLAPLLRRVSVLDLYRKK
jgi:hypothetical protein